MLNHFDLSRRAEYFRFGFVLLWLFLPWRCAIRQETVFDVPSADILDKGKVYGELDGTVRDSDPSATFTPRVVFGVGHGVEVGLNFDGLGAPEVGSAGNFADGEVEDLERRGRGVVFLRGRRFIFSGDDADV